jgi:hypothetical protein
MNRFIGHSQVVTTNNYNNLKITVTLAHKMKYSMSVCYSLLGNESYRINILLMNTQLLNCLLNPLANESLEFKNELSFITSGGPNSGHHAEQFMFWSDVRCSGN